MTPRQRSPSAAQLREHARENQSLLAAVLVGIVFVRQRVVLRCNRHLAAGQREGVCACGCGFSRAVPARHAPALADRHWAVEAQP